VLVETKPPELLRTASSSYGMFSSVAAATLALKVMATTFADVMTALCAVAPTTSVVYAGVPLSATGWSNVTVTIVVAAVAAVTLMGFVFCGEFAVAFARHRAFERVDFPMIAAAIVALLKIQRQVMAADKRG
jgi:hypothetical protein